MIHPLRCAMMLSVLALSQPIWAQSAPPLTELQIAAVSSATQAERIAPDQRETTRRHTGPVTIVVRETGIGRARLLRVDGVTTSAPSSQRPLCGAAMSPGACKPGETVTGVEITYHLDPLRSGATVSVQDSSMNLPARTLIADIIVR